MRALFLLLILPASGIQIWSSPDIPDAVPLACREALAYNITCANALVRAQDVTNGAALPKEEAELYCTKGCQSSLEAFQQEVSKTCGDGGYVLHKKSTTKQYPLALAHKLIWAYNISCLQDSTGYCLTDLYGAVIMSSDYGREQFPLGAYSSLLSSWEVPASSYPYSYTELPTFTPTTSTSNATTSMPTPCGGTTYTVKDGNTCESISYANSVGTDRMIQRNYLDYYCSSLSLGSEICIEELCKGIIQGQSFEMVQLLGWNPTLWDDCANLDSMTGRSLCISPPGGDGNFALPPPHSTTRQDCDHDYTPTPITYTPNATYTSLINERLKYCWITDEQFEDEYFDPYDMEEDCVELFEDYCEAAVTDPVPMSPSSIPRSCTPTSESSTTTTSEDTSTATSQTAAPTPTPTQAHMVSGCTGFHHVESGDECGTIAAKYDIPVQDFYDWNPDIGDECKALWLNYYVCVGRQSSGSTTTKHTTTTKPTSTTTTSSGIATPTPTQSGMVKNCTKFHKGESGDQCGTIASENKIALDDFYT
ncbi:hypothetical protein BDV06DRAFT_233336 [Aspergillus oleicola]